MFYSFILPSEVLFKQYNFKIGNDWSQRKAANLFVSSIVLMVNSFHNVFIKKSNK